MAAVDTSVQSQSGSPDDTTARRGPRTLVLCFDGTADQYDGENTNVVKFYSLLKKDDDGIQQLCYYQPGIGTYFNPGVVSPLFQWGAKVLDEAFAWYLDAHVRGGYQFLMENYVVGDKICIFGFSRGAYTARALAGMLHKIGLLPRDNPEQVPFAYKLYKQTDSNSVDLAAGFKRTFCRDVKIEFVGVWETVASVGVIMRRSLPFTASNTTTKTFRHALSLDERRVRFLPNLYHRSALPSDGGVYVAKKRVREVAERILENEAKAVKELAKGHKAVNPSMTDRKQKSFVPFLRRWSSSKGKDAAPKIPREQAVDLEAGTAATVASSGESSSNAQERWGDEIEGGTDVLEVWFAGCHADVGGSATSDDTKLSLSDITLRWMVREAVLAQCGVKFDRVAVVRAGIPDSIFTGSGVPVPPDMLIPAPPRLLVSKDTPGPSTPTTRHGASSGNDSQQGNDSDDDPLDVGQDALQPIHDELELNKWWWLLEIIPLSYQVKESDGKWHTKWWIHLGRGRQLPDAPKFHITVKQRMEDASLKYTPRAKWTAGTEIYVI